MIREIRMRIEGEKYARKRIEQGKRDRREEGEIGREGMETG